MSTEQTRNNSYRYYYVIDGSFRTLVPKDHPEAVVRVWEKDGKTGEKPEKHVQALFGQVVGLDIKSGDYGKVLNIYLDQNEDGETPVMSFGVETRYGDDMLKKVPHLKENTEYRFLPFSFTPEGKDKKKSGISVNTKDAEGNYTERVLSFFFDGKQNINGYPEATEEDKEDWAFYYKKANKFMVKYAEEHVLPKWSKSFAEQEAEYPTEDINPADIPF